MTSRLTYPDLVLPLHMWPPTDLVDLFTTRKPNGTHERTHHLPLYSLQYIYFALAVRGYFIPYHGTYRAGAGEAKSLAFSQYFHGGPPKGLPTPPTDSYAPFLETQIGNFFITNYTMLSTVIVKKERLVCYRCYLIIRSQCSVLVGGSYDGFYSQLVI